jgi:hypothetical protein
VCGARDIGEVSAGESEAHCVGEPSTSERWSGWGMGLADENDSVASSIRHADSTIWWLSQAVYIKPRR